MWRCCSCLGPALRALAFHSRLLESREMVFSHSFAFLIKVLSNDFCKAPLPASYSSPPPAISTHGEVTGLHLLFTLMTITHGSRQQSCPAITKLRGEMSSMGARKLQMKQWRDMLCCLHWGLWEMGQNPAVTHRPSVPCQRERSTRLQGQWVLLS